MSGALLKKALRDLRSHAGAYLACAMLMAIGVVFYSSMTRVAANMPVAQHQFYEDYRFADAFAQVRALPASRIERLNAIEGVKKASGRLTANARVVDMGREDTIELKLISYDPAEADRVNDISVITGAAPSSGAYSVLLNEMFYNTNGLTEGDTITIALRGRKVSLTVSGSVQMPEYIYLTPEGAIMPDDKSYGVAYVPLDVLESLLDRRGEVNDVAFLFEQGIEFDNMERVLKDALAQGGLIKLIPRKDQTSHNMLETEMLGIQSMVSVVPVIFLLLGALIMSVVIKRMVEQQHAQIGLMKAFGYAQRDIILHYAIYGVVIGLLASVIGGVLGALVAGYMADLYTAYFVMPGISGSFSLGDVFSLSVLALMFGVGASLYGARGVLRLSAAESMRPPAPPSGKPIILERIRVFWNAISAITQLSLRNLFRSRSRSLLTFIGLSVCYMLMAAVFAFNPMVDYMMKENFVAVQQYDLKISLTDMAEANSVAAALNHMSEVEKVEPVLELPLTVRKGSQSEDMVLMALPRGATLYQLFDDKRQRVRMPERGLVMTYRMAEKLHVSVGDSVLLDIAYPDEEVYATVTALSEQYTSNYIITDNAYLSTLLRTQEMASGALLTVDKANSARLREKLNDASGVAGVMDLEQMLKTLTTTMETSMSMLYVMAVMAVFAGFAIVYNASVVILSERTRELASMRVLGFTLAETVRVVAMEQLLLCAAGVLMGLPMAGYIMQALSEAMATDAFAIPTDVPFSAHITSVFSMLSAWIVAMLVAARKVRRTPMAEVLKGRD